MPRSRMRLEHADAVDAGHDQVEDDRRHVAAARAVERLECRLAAIGDDRLVAECVTAASSSRRCTGSSSTMRMGRVMLVIEKSPMSDDCRLDHLGTGF